MSRLKDKIALVTGGARGMGAATVELFVKEGARVIITDVLDAEGKALAQRLGPAAHFIHHDVGDEASWATVAEQARKQFGEVDVLVNNAGVLIFKTLLETSREDFERILRINLIGSFLGIKSIAPGMIARGKGSIVNISSSDGMKGANGLAAYASSKWGVRGLTRVAAMELGHRGVRVNSVHPGGIDTAIANPTAAPRAEFNQRFGFVPLQRSGGPEEVAQVNLFLASDESSYLCGAEIAVDGGMLAGQYYVGFPGAPGV